MPAIRDKSFAYEAATTDGGITLPICDYAAGDLLIAIGVGDTGAPTWGCSNGVGTWTQLVSLSNTASIAIWWKYATSGEGDVVMTASVNETYSGILLSVYDVFQGYTAGSQPLQANATSTGTAIALPTLTTPTNDCLCLAAISSSGTSSISFMNSALQSLAMVDGTAEGLGVGWFYQPTASLTTAHVATSLASAAGSKIVVAIRPPAGGATVRPTYPIADASILLTPQPGIAYDGNTAMAATADTNFGTSLGGRTATDATVTSVNDIGIDNGSFMSMSGLTNAATANTVAGAAAVVAAARYDIGTRNILGHFRHPTPVNNQRLAPISSNRGVWFGMRSGATAGTNYKIWQVHGGDAKLSPGYVQPFVINNTNTDTRVTAGTLSTTDVRAYGFWTSGVGILTQQSCFGPVWAMDTITLCGGSALEPMDVSGIVYAAAYNKVRYSSVLQGSNQALMYQAIQIGNGSAPTYLDLTASAIEFPSKRNVPAKLINYNGADNSVGITYYAAATDTIIHSSAVVSSASPYHWRIHPSFNTAASYNFSGLSVIGAGDVQLKAGMSFNSMTFTNCPAITNNGTLTYKCTFNNSTLNITNTSPLDLVAENTFNSVDGTGHAIVITGSIDNSTVSLNSTFNGYEESNGSTGNEAIYVNIASGTLTINYSGAGAPSIRTAGATVNVVFGATVTFTGLPLNTDVVVLTAGTSTILAQVDQNATSSYAWSYQGTPTVDVGFINPGYKPQYIRNLTLGTTNSSIPVAMQVDRAYS